LADTLEFVQRHPHFEIYGEAEKGAEAIEEVKRVKPDVVVLNVTMPLVNGFQAAREIKNQIPETAIVILSPHADKYLVAETKKAGVRFYVPKSKIGQVLVESVRSCGGRGRFYRPLVGRAAHGRMAPARAPARLEAIRECHAGECDRGG
jgi:DNA-binding NarL/FixJ family response regulator